ncbi:MAG TPA: hypothetical protein VF477_07475 [Mycobacterium sp.]
MGRVNGRSPTHQANQPPVTLVSTIITGVVAGVSEVVKHAVARLESAIAALGNVRESVTLKPGDTLIVRISPDRWSSEQAREYEEHLNARLGVPVKLVAADELVVQQGEGPG